MITCNRCGKLVPADVKNCQYCGASVSEASGAGQGQKKATSGQSSLPAWLESLRVDERPGLSPIEPSNFSASDLVDDGSLPSWMRPGGQDMSGNTGPHSWSNPPTPEPNSELGFSANSLIDEQSLPSWMQENKATPPQATPEQNISASSLLQQDAVPDWMKNMQPSRGQQQPSAPLSQPPQTPAQQGQPPVGRGFSAKDLVDESALPSWMAGAGQGQQNRPEPQGQGNTGPQSGISAASLLDPNSLPSWMAAQGPQTKPEPKPQGQEINRPASGISAASLLDPNSLPDWMAGQNKSEAKPQKPQSNNEPQSGLSAASLLDPNSLPNWMRENEQKSGASVPPQTGNQGQSYQNGLSAPSLIDVNALPEWLRNGGGLSQQGPSTGAPGGIGQQQPQGQGFNTPQQNVRVPSRPRGEQGVPEQSEAAANVFASMLGVASNKSPMPGQPSGPNTLNGQQSFSGIPGMGMGTTPQGGPAQQGQSPIPGTPQGQPSWMQSLQPGGSNQGYNPPSQPQGQPQWMQQMGSTPGQQGGYPNGGNQPGYSSYPPANQQGQPGMSGFSSPDSGQGRNAGKTEKRGFLETILGWFSFSR